MPCEPALQARVPCVPPLPNVGYFLDDYGIRNVDENHLAYVFGELCTCRSSNLTRYRQCQACGRIPIVPLCIQGLAEEESLAAALYIEHLYLSMTSGTPETVFRRLGLLETNDDRRVILQIVTRSYKAAEETAKYLYEHRKCSRWLSRYCALAGETTPSHVKSYAEYNGACLRTRVYGDIRLTRGMTALAVVKIGRSADVETLTQSTKTIRIACLTNGLMDSRYWPMFAGRTLG